MIKILPLLSPEQIAQLTAIAALEGTRMDPPNYARLQLVQANLTRMWTAG